MSILFPSKPSHMFSVVILAADRGKKDPVAQAGGVVCKSLVPVCGIPMLERVITALMPSPWIKDIAVSLTDKHILNEFGGLQKLVESKRVFAIEAQTSPSQSVLYAIDNLSAPYPLLITTADHALLTTQMVDHFCALSANSGADICVGLTGSRIIKSNYPDSVRTYLKFQDGEYSGSNLFALNSEASVCGPRLWVKTEKYRKQPWKIAREFGLCLLMSYLFRRHTLAHAFQHLGTKMGLHVKPIIMPFAEAAIDVDTLQDLKHVEDILRRTG